MHNVMNRSLLFFNAALALMVSCQQEQFEDNSLPENVEHKRILSIGAVQPEQDTRVGFDETNSFYWHSGDRVGVQTKNGFKEMVLQDEYAGKPSGVFEGTFEEEMMSYVVYPHQESHSIESEVLTYILPDSYVYETIEEGANSFNPPMLGRIDGDNAMLNHLASFFKIYVEDIPAGGDDMSFVFTTDKRITGSFYADLTDEYPVLTTDDEEGKTVTIKFSNTKPGVDGVFYVPAPLGTYGSVSVEVKDGEESLAAKTWTNQEVKRKTPKKGVLAIDYVAEVNGKLYRSLQEAFDAVDNQTVNLLKDVSLDASITLSQGKTAVFDMNDKTVSGVATSASASNLFVVKGGANLTIKNGTVSFAATTPDTQWGGEGQAPYPGYANNTVRNEGVLTVENAILENKTMKGGASYVVDNYNGAKLTVNDGSLLKQSGGDIAIRMFNGSAGSIDVTINGGTVIGYRAVWIQLASSDSAVAPCMNLTVSDGTLESIDEDYKQAVYSYSYGNDMKNVVININGGTFNGDVALTGGSNKTNIETLNITGGTFNGLWGDIYSYGADEAAAEKINITGGTFSDIYPLYYMAGDNGNIGIKLAGDIELDGTLTIPYGNTVLLDLNGNTISQVYKQTAGYQMILNDGELIINDTLGGGGIVYTDSGEGGEYVSNTITNRGTLTVKGGTVENLSSETVARNGYPYAIDSSIWGEASEVVTNIQGGTVRSTYSPIRLRADSQTENVETNISDGDIYGRIDHQMSSSAAGVKGILNISGGTFNQYGVTTSSLQVFGAGVNTDASGIVLNVSGGEFKAPIVVYKGDYVPIGSNFNEKFITGGTFSFYPGDFLADGYTAEQIGDIWYVNKDVLL